MQKYEDIIYPTNLAKYRGVITPDFKVIIKKKVTQFSSYKEAFDFLLEVNIENEWVKNTIYDYGAFCEVEIRKDIYMKFDKQDIDLVQSRLIWGIKRNLWYAVMMNFGKIILFHNYIMAAELMKHQNYTVDHINQDSLDNRRCNLRVADKSTQGYNRPLHKHNKSGTSGVFYVIKNGKEYWVAKWFVNGVQKQKYFNLAKYPDAKKKAINHRKEMESKFFI